MNNGHLYGISEEGLEFLPKGQRLHVDAIEALKNMADAALKDGIHIEVASGFRSFERQVVIWNRKFLSDTLCNLSVAEKIDSIMQWSALPGTSRHHWGSDCDLYDPIALNGDKLKLEPWEYAPEGSQFHLFHWLEQNAKQYGFFRPYATHRGGVSPEPWHWSFAPLAEAFLDAYDVAPLMQIIKQSNLQGKSFVIPELSNIVARYVKNVDRFND